MFRRKRVDVPSAPVHYPDGVMVETESGAYYIRGGKRFKLFSERAKWSWALNPIPSSEAALSTTPRARAPLGFRDGTLIHNVADGRLYLISGNKRRHITSPDVLGRLGMKRGDALVVSQEEVSLHLEGDELT